MPCLCDNDDDMWWMHLNAPSKEQNVRLHRHWSISKICLRKKEKKKDTAISVSTVFHWELKQFCDYLPTYLTVFSHEPRLDIRTLDNLWSFPGKYISRQSNGKDKALHKCQDRLMTDHLIIFYIIILVSWLLSLKIVFAGCNFCYGAKRVQGTRQVRTKRKDTKWKDIHCQVYAILSLKLVESAKQ